MREHMPHCERVGRIEELRLGIEIALKIKFGAAGLPFIQDIKDASDLEPLRAVLRAIESAKSLDDLRRVYAAPPTPPASRPKAKPLFPALRWNGDFDHRVGPLATVLQFRFRSRSFPLLSAIHLMCQRNYLLSDIVSSCLSELEEALSTGRTLDVFWEIYLSRAAQLASLTGAEMEIFPKPDMVVPSALVERG